MWKRPIFLFLLLTLFFVVGAVLFIQSVYFSKFIKQVAIKYVPQELGMQFDFDNLSIELFPPGISFVKPKLSLKKENALQLPENATISAEKVILSFLPLQMVSGNIRIHKVTIEKGNLQFPFEVGFFSKRKTKKSRPFQFTWEELVQIRADSVHLKDSELRFVFNEVGLDLNFFAHSVVLQKWKDDGGDGYQALVNLQNITGILPQKSKIPFHLEKLDANLTLNSYGFLLESLQAAEKSIQLDAKGHIRGDLFSTKDWLADIKINTLGQLSDFFTAIHYQKNQVLLGKAKFDGQFKGNLLHIMDSLRLEGVLQVIGASYQKWSADELKLNGSWSLSPRGSELHVLKGQIESKELKREGESQAGWGGKIELGEFRVNLAEAAEIPLPLELKRAHLHWLVGSDFKSIYPFNFRASGPLHLIYKTSKKENEAWTLQSKIKLKLDEFQLDNQDYGKKKLLKRILNIQDVILDGEVQINSQGIQVKDLSLDLPKTHFKLGGGFNFTAGFDLTAVGNVHLQDIKHIGEIEIFGDGKLKTHVIGPLSGVAIHFEHELTDARYLNLNFGNINGKIIYDIGKSELKLSQVEATKGTTVYAVDGKVDFKADKVDINTKIQKGTVQDLVLVFEDLTKLVPWFPKKIIGKLKGSADIHGGLDLSQLEIISQIEGEQWEYAGEKFKTVSLTGGFDKGTYYIKRIQAIKHHSLISGSISIDSKKYLKWGFNSSSLDLNEWDHIARLDIPLRGRVELFTFGEGILGLVQSTTKFSFPEIYLRGSKLPPCFFELSHFGNAIHILARLFENQGQLEVNYNTREGVYSSLKGTLREFDFTPFLFFLNPKLIQDSSLVSTVSGRLDINFKTSEWEKIRGKIELFEYNLKKTDFDLQLKEPVSVKIENGSFSQADISLVGKESKAVLSLKSTNGVLEGSLLGSCDLMLLEFFTPLAVQTKGQALFDLILSGALTNPQFFGKIEFSQAGFKIPALDSPLENITGQVQFKQNKILFKEVQADLAQGRVGLDGEIQLFLNKFPELSLVVVLQGSRLKIFPFQYVKTQGKIQVTGTALPYMISGQVQVESALIKEKIFGATTAYGLKSAKYTPPPSANSEVYSSKFNLDILATAENAVLIQNDLFDAELKGRVNIIHTLDVPRLLGSAEIIQGKVIFKDRMFQILSGNLQFNNPTVIDPEFSLNASTEIGQTKIFLYTSGNLKKYKIELNSNPALPDTEIISLLALGFTSEDVKKMGAEERGTLDKSGAAALLLHSMDFNRDIQTRTGLQIQLEESLSQPYGTSAFRPKVEGETLAAPKIVVKRKIGEKLELSLGSTVGLGTSSEREINAEYTVTPNFSVIGVWDTLESGDAKSTTSFGVDLKLQRKFR